MNFFVTGNEVFAAGIDLKFVTPKGSHGANFSADGQSLSESLSIAQEVFARVRHGKIDFVLIGLAPDCLFQGGNVDENLNALSEYLKLCLDNNTKPVCVIFPIAPSVREHYRKKFVEPLREILAELKKIYDFDFIDLFDLPFNESYFTDESLNLGGTNASSTLLTFALYRREIISLTEFCHMNYEYFFDLAYFLPADVFQKLMDEIFQSTISELKRRNKFKIAFVIYNAAMWCGDELYNFFARDKRFETTIFACLNSNNCNEIVERDFWFGVNQLKSRGLNVDVLLGEDAPASKQDLLIFLTPHTEMRMPQDLQFTALTAETLIVYLPYYLDISIYEISNFPIMRISWKVFFDTKTALEIYDEKSTVGMPRGLYSGMPKLDVFFDEQKHFHFDWKLTRPDAKKIIWAPHYSIIGIPHVRYATFQWNYKFMYEFAKNHPETSWVVKPHPELLFAAVETEVFPSVEAFEEYLQAWNNLPNAQVYTGTYYQDIFATSDGMIQDSGSFIGEYQYTRKPMIFLTRDTQEFNELGKRILDVSYCVDGRDLDGIAVLMQKVFIDGDDPLKSERQKVFDELLNYRRVNGMSASEYIYRSITDELEG